MSSLASNPAIKVFPRSDSSYLLTYLDSPSPQEGLAVGSSTANPPTPGSFTQNPRFLSILNEVLEEYACDDTDFQSSALAFAGPGGATLGSGGLFFAQQHQNRTRRANKAGNADHGGGGGAGGGGGGGASAQGGAGGGGKGGWVHLSDTRNPPDYGRIAWPEDILGTAEVDGHGKLLGNFQPSGTYRIITNEGILGLGSFLTQKLVSRLREEEESTHAKASP